MAEQLQLIPDEPPRLVPVRIHLNEIVIPVVGPLDSGFVASIKRWGIMQPPVVRLKGECAFIVDGRRRIAAIKQIYNDNPRIDCLNLIGNASPEVLALMLNDQRAPNPVSDLKAIEDLIAGGANEHDIQQATGMAIPTIRKRMSLKRLSDGWRREFDEGKVAVSIAEALAKLPEQQQEGLHIDWVNKDCHLTRKDIAAVRQVRQTATIAELPDALFEVVDESPPSASDIAVMYPADHLLTPEEARLPMYGGNDQRSWYERARDFMDTLLPAPEDVPTYVSDELGFLQNLLHDLAESQAVGFLAEGERVDTSDVVPMEIEIETCDKWPGACSCITPEECVGGASVEDQAAYQV